MRWTILGVLLAGCGGAIEQREPAPEPVVAATVDPQPVGPPQRVGWTIEKQVVHGQRTSGLGAPCDPTVGPVNCGYPTAVCMGLDSPLLETDWIGRCTTICWDNEFTASCAAMGGKCVTPFVGSEFLMCAN